MAIIFSFGQTTTGVTTGVGSSVSSIPIALKV